MKPSGIWACRVVFAGQNSEISANTTRRSRVVFALIELFWLPAFSGNPTLQRGVSNLHRDQYISHQFCEILIQEQRGVWKSREVFGSEQRGVWPNTSLLNFKHLSALVFGRFPLVSRGEWCKILYYSRPCAYFKGCKLLHGTD